MCIPYGFLFNFFPCIAADYMRRPEIPPTCPFLRAPASVVLPSSRLLFLSSNRLDSAPKRKSRPGFSCRQAVPAITVPGSCKVSIARSSLPGSAVW